MLQNDESSESQADLAELTWAHVALLNASRGVGSLDSMVRRFAGAAQIEEFELASAKLRDPHLPGLVSREAIRLTRDEDFPSMMLVAHQEGVGCFLGLKAAREKAANLPRDPVEMDSAELLGAFLVLLREWPGSVPVPSDVFASDALYKMDWGVLSRGERHWYLDVVRDSQETHDMLFCDHFLWRWACHELVPLRIGDEIAAGLTELPAFGRLREAGVQLLRQKIYHLKRWKDTCAEFYRMFHIDTKCSPAVKRDRGFLVRIDELLERASATGIELPEGNKKLDMLREITEVKDLVVRSFVAQQRWNQASERTCPSTFFVFPDVTQSWPSRLVGSRVKVQLCCEAPGEVHPTAIGGCYELENPQEWFTKMAPYLAGLVKVLQSTAPIVAAGWGVVDSNMSDTAKAQFALTKELVKVLPDYIGKGTMPSNPGDVATQTARGAALRAFAVWLNKVDLSKTYGGLEEVWTTEGDRLWLCPEHAALYRSRNKEDGHRSRDCDQESGV